MTGVGLRLLLAGGLLAMLAGCGSATTTKTIVRTSPSTPTTSTTSTTPASTTSTTSATATSASTAPVYFQGVVGPAALRPATLQLTGDGTLAVEHVQWTSWGGPVAAGTGNAIYHGCNPNCAEAQVRTAVVSVRLSDVRVCGGRRYYSGLTLTSSSGALLDNQFVQRSWSPC